ncbi:odorant receptor 9a [Monomorium pharaonis]|uniref:odorant receptor 9a n=1 Tax=Monomorium pharaonis TaxID=307658 RepID=UPI001746CA4A|nr:odorant receptor 9a [Monomorium pharaonis]
MIRSVIQHHKFNRILLLAVGLWPYHQSKFTRIQFIFLSVILSASVIFQLTPLIILKCTSDLIIKVLSSVSFFMLFLIKYNSCHLNIEAVKYLFMELQDVFNNLKDENEIAIVEKYIYVTKRFTFVLTAFGVCGISASIIVEFWSIVDIPINVSQSHHLFIMTKHFVDEKYFYLIMLYMYTILCIVMTVMLGTGTWLITYLQNICGMFKIASHRIEHAVNNNISQNIMLKNKIFMNKGVIYAVDMHRQAIKLTENFMSTFEIMIFCFTLCVVICFSLNLFQLFQIQLSKNNIKEFLLPLMYATVSIIYMFVANYMGQNIFDHNNHVFITAYNVRWYKTPVHIQKMILFLLQRGTKKVTLNVGGIFEGTIEHFATLLKASISYFTVIYSTQ